MADVYVKGLKELGVFLQQVPLKIERNIARGALRAGANVIKDQAKANVPVSAPSDKNRQLYGGYAGALRDSIRVSSSRSGKRGKVQIAVRAGGKQGKAIADTYYAKFVEYGTKPHKNGSRGMHPGAKPHPFMRPAVDQTQGAATVAVGNYMKRRLEQHNGLNMPDIVIEEE